MPLDHDNHNGSTLMSAEFQLQELKRILASSGMGTWSIEITDGQQPRMHVDEMMAKLLGIGELNHLTPEQVYDSWYDRIKPEAVASVSASVCRMMLGEVDENTYLWNHPTLGDRYVRCGGSGKRVSDKTYVLSGYHYDVTVLVLKEKEQQKAMKEAMAELQRNYDIIRYMAKSFSSIYYIDLEADSFIELGTNVKEVHELIGSDGCAQEKLLLMCDKIVKPEWKDKMLGFSDLKWVREQLKEKGFVRQQFEGRFSGWSEASFIAANRGDDGYCTHVLWTTVDINEQKDKDLKYRFAFEEAKRSAEQANRAKSKFLFNMSHDIRTPMNAIIGFAGLLEKHQDEPERREDYLNKIKESSALLLGLINNVLEMARIERGHMELDIQAWGVEQMYDSFCSIFMDMMIQKGLTFCHSMDVEHDCIFCDPVKVREVIINLLSNAYKYTPSGGKVEFHIRQLPCEEEGYTIIETIVSDTGNGMSPDFLPHIYEEFTREYTTTDARIEGSGLGMPIVKKLLDLMGGTIEVKSELGKGTTFYVRVKHRIAEKSDLLSVDMPDLSDVDFKGRRILLAEDNDLNAEIAIEILQEVDLVVERAENGKQCVEMLQSSPAGYYDLILMDIQMPEMNGYEATRTIRALEDKVKANITILAMTANAFEEDKREALNAGMNAHLSKPIEVDKLIKTLKRSLHSHK